MRKKGLNLQILLSLAFCTEVLYVVIASFDNLRFHIPVYLLCYGGAFLLYWIASTSFFELNWGNQKSERKKQLAKYPLIARIKWLNSYFVRQKAAAKLSVKEVLTVGIIFGVIFRLTFLFTPTSLSDDIYRYIWDGKVASQGINPFLYPPNADILSTLQEDEIYPNINHNEISTIYPPVSQMVFFAISKLHATVLGFKIAFLIFDSLTVWLLFLLLKKLSLNIKRLLLYLWNPLIIIEIAGNGHVDILGIFFLTLSLLFLIQRRFLGGIFTLALAFLTKFFAGLILPVMTLVKKEYKLSVVLLFILISATFYLPYTEAGERLLTGLIIYSQKWQFNASMFSVILTSVKSVLPEEWIIKWMITPSGMGVDPETIATRGTDLALMISKVLVVVFFSGIVAYYLFRFKKDFTREGNIWIFKVGLIFFGLFFLLNPTVQPWYLCWLLPFLVIAPNRAYILLTGLVGLSYWSLMDFTRSGIWQENNWIKMAEYLPFYLVLVFDFAKNKLQQNKKLVIN